MLCHFEFCILIVDFRKGVRSMSTGDVNYVTVIVAAVVYMILGFLWYGPLFGKPWMKLIGMGSRDMQAAKKGMQITHALTMLAAIVMFYVLIHFINVSNATTASEGAMVGFWAWLGFVATTGANDFFFSVKPKPWNLYFLNQGYLLVGLMMGGAILAGWK